MVHAAIKMCNVSMKLVLIKNASLNESYIMKLMGFNN